MKAWQDDKAGSADPGAAAGDAETLAELERRGIDLDPTAGRAPAAHDHEGAEPGHSHPHRHADPGEPPLIGVIGAGAV